jgi:hypothetical protein
MKILVPQAAGEIIEQLNDHGFEAYVVGGCVCSCGRLKTGTSRPLLIRSR